MVPEESPLICVKVTPAPVPPVVGSFSNGGKSHATTALVSRERTRRFLFKVDILGLFDRDPDGEYRPALELPG
jgi:hypothetical protein